MLIKRINYKLYLGFILSLLLFICPTAKAGYVPPKTQKPPSDQSRSGGTRGCSEEKIPLTILAPTTHVGYTASFRPTFVWFLYNSYETDFRIFEFDTNNRLKQLGNPIKLQASKGINKYSLPKSQPELTVGKRYLWQVAIFCPEGAFLVQRAEFLVVKPSSDFINKLSKTGNGSQRVNLFANESLWYDALEEALKLAPNSKLGEVGASLVQSLMQSEKQEGTLQEQQEIQQKFENVKAIINSQT
ncbi:DUF928 domain-containing protein [Scytonema sp. HK-05]|uniref:DUF928 domain-containing protein n=1 Tax=Scytonema sp. HK-05 TaxID=1137095 RepID=UPI001E4C2759|nr:DUF928 domain-containing protein [Scytonema sp. HK-05]